MIWLNPLALIGAAAIVAPILIHILVQRRAPPFAFPTLRFLQPARLSAIRRHLLEDLPLLLVRAAILAIAAGALAGPLLVTPARRAGWNDRMARAMVIARDLDGDRGRRAALSGPPAVIQTTIETSDLRDGIARAIAWFDASPPAKRELVVVAPFALGSLTRADLGDVPPETGIRLVRSGQLPEMRSLAAAPVLDAALAPFSVSQRNRTVDLIGPSTSVREDAPAPGSVPIEIVAAEDMKRAADATLAAVLSQRVPAPVPGRFARVVFEPGPRPPRSVDAFPPKPLAKAGAPTATLPWMMDAIAQLTIDGEVLSSAAVDGNALVVTTGLPPTDLRTAKLFRSILRALAVEDRSANPQPLDPRATPQPPDRSAKALAEREILPISDADLRAWERPAASVSSPRLDTIERDDRRWWWGAAVMLLALETWLRRSRRERAEQIEVENARVA